MMEEILLIHDSLSFVVDINLDENADYKVCIYEDASKLIYNDESLEKALPKPWESEKIFGYFYKIIKGQNGESSSEKIIESKKFGIRELC